MNNEEIRATLDRYWEATMVHDLKKAHEFYHDDIVVEFPQSGEQIRGKVAVAPMSMVAIADTRTKYLVFIYVSRVVGFVYLS